MNTPQSVNLNPRELAKAARALQKAVRAPAARLEALRLKGEADAILAEV